jgi:hypothetical protein
MSVPSSRTSPRPPVHRMVTICPRPSAGASLPHRPGSPRNGLCSLHFEPWMDTDQHGSKVNLQWPPVRIHSLRDKRPNAAIERPREPANVRAGVHGSPCGFRLSGKLQQYATSARHAESVNSSAEPRASIAFHRPTSRTRRREAREGLCVAEPSRLRVRPPKCSIPNVLPDRVTSTAACHPQPRPAGSTRDHRLFPRAPPPDTMPRGRALRHRRTPFDRNGYDHRGRAGDLSTCDDLVAASGASDGSWAAVVCGRCAAGRPSASRRSVILPRRRGGGKHFFASSVRKSEPRQPSP